MPSLSPTYAELRCKSAFSFLEGASSPGELFDQAHQLGLQALALTDRNGVYGIPRAYAASRSKPDLKLLVGAELTLGAPHSASTLTLIARTRAAYGLLCRILTAAHAGREKGQAFLGESELQALLEAAPPSARKLIALSLISPEGEQSLQIAELREHFAGRFYLGLGRFLDGHDRRRTQHALALQKKFGCPIVATNDVHFHQPSRRALQEVVTSLRHGTPLRETGRRLFPNAERYLLPPALFRERFQDLPEAVTRTLEIAESCTFSPSELKYRYPSEWIPHGHTAHSYLAELTWQGARRRYEQELGQGGVPSDVARQLEHELRLISELGFADYFLTIWEIVEFAKSRDILCQGRGSAANSAVCFVLGITAVDPVRMNLLFERFISAERGEPPDIDVDFESERREEVIQHIYEKYGRDRAAMVSAVVTFRSKLARREVARVLEVPHDSENPVLKKIADELYGFPRHLSIHSGGFTLSADPIIEIVPVEPARMEARTIIQWDKNDLETLGLLKVDILSLGMLSALKRSFTLINTHREAPPLTLANIPAEDPPTYAMIQRADTVGTFQVESRAQMSMLPRLLPKTFYDLVVQVAIVRPGPIQGGMVHPYLRRRKGLEPATLPDPRLEPILGKTLGVPLFQEQIMKVAVTLAGFSPGEADELRRAIGAWRSNGSMEKMGHRLREGLAKNGVPTVFAEQIFQQIQGFSQYGFPESHAASFALLSYASCYLKAHHPAEFLCALINAQPMGFYSVHTLIDDAKRHGVHVLPIDPALSAWDCTMEGRAVRLGFCVVQGIPRQAVAELLETRTETPFRDLGDFLNRTQLPPLVLHRLALGDAFRIWGHEQRDALWIILGQTPFATLETTQGQLSLFGDLPLSHAGQTSAFAPLRGFEAIRSDYSAYRLSVRGHPMAALRPHLPERLRGTSLHARSTSPGKRTRASGLAIIRQRPPTAKGVTFATLEDEHGFLDLILYPDIYETGRDVFEQYAFVAIEGKVQRDGGAISILVDRVSALNFEAANHTKTKDSQEALQGNLSPVVR